MPTPCICCGRLISWMVPESYRGEGKAPERTRKCMVCRQVPSIGIMAKAA